MTERKIDYSKIELLEPVWKDNYVAIAMSSSNEYVPYLSVCLQSLIDNSSSEHNYDIIIFERNIGENEKSKLYKQVSPYINISLRFINPMNIISQYNLKFHSRYNLECYFRLTAPIILKNYSKVIYTDIDLVFNADIYDLYSINLEGYSIAACQDLMWHAFINNPLADWAEYGTEQLKLNDLYKYFNTGVMLINTIEFNTNNYSFILLDLLEKKHYRILEQDGLNSFFQSNIKYIETTWNVPIVNNIYAKIIDFMPQKTHQQYLYDRDNAKIVHFAGRGKPWNNPYEDLAYIWWQYARRSPYYEIILQRMFASIKNKSDLSKEDFACVTSYRKNVLAYWRYKLLSKITFGKTKKHYKEKRALWKEKIKRAKKIRGLN